MFAIVDWKNEVLENYWIEKWKKKILDFFVKFRNSEFEIIVVEKSEFEMFMNEKKIIVNEQNKTTKQNKLCIYSTHAKKTVIMSNKKIRKNKAL